MSHSDSPPLASDPAGEVYFEGEYSYRKISVLLIGAIGSPIFLFLFVSVLKGMFAKFEWSWAWLGTLLFTGGITGMMSFATLSLLYAWCRRRVYRHAVTDAGVTVANRFYPWEDVGDLTVYRERKGGERYQLLLHRRGRVSADRHLMCDRAMTEEEADALLDKLSERIGPRHPHVYLG